MGEHPIGMLPAEVIAASSGAGNDPQPVSPVLHGRLLSSGAPLYLQSRASGQTRLRARAVAAAGQDRREAQALDPATRTAAGASMTAEVAP